MKGRVFIGWSGDTTIARDVKEKLKKEGFEGIVGGETGTDMSLYLGEAILKEIDSSNQGLFIFQKKKDGSISSSTMFELGYALSRLNRNKIHVFYIDIPENDVSIPTDLKGIWAKHLYDVEDSKIDDRVVECFLANQRKIVIWNKMDIINAYYETRRAFDTYSITPFCSEYELPQYVLFFSQAAYMFNDIREGQKCMDNLVNSIRGQNSEELEQAMKFARFYMGIFSHISGEDGRIFLEEDYFIRAKRAFKAILETVKNWPEQKQGQEKEFTTWLELLALESLNYIHILRAACPGITESRQNRLLQQSFEYAFACLEKCNALAADPDSETDIRSNNEQCLSLYRAYMYRNLSTAYMKLGRQAEANRYLKLSYEERMKLLEYYQLGRRVSSRLFENIEMEYYLACSEMLEYPEDEDMSEENMASCRSYLDKIKKLHLDKSHYIERIEQNLKSAEDKL